MLYYLFSLAYKRSTRQKYTRIMGYLELFVLFITEVNIQVVRVSSGLLPFNS